MTEPVRAATGGRRWQEEAVMRCKVLAQAATGLAVLVLPSLVAAQASPPMGGGYTNVIPIPVDNPTMKAISGALFKPEGAGPFPTVVYLPGCAGVGPRFMRSKRRSLTIYKPKESPLSLSTLSRRAVSCTGAAAARSAPRTPLRR